MKKHKIIYKNSGIILSSIIFFLTIPAHSREIVEAAPEREEQERTGTLEEKSTKPPPILQGQPQEQDGDQTGTASTITIKSQPETTNPALQQQEQEEAGQSGLTLPDTSSQEEETPASQAAQLDLLKNLQTSWLQAQKEPPAHAFGLVFNAERSTVLSAFLQEPLPPVTSFKDIPQARTELEQRSTQLSSINTVLQEIQTATLANINTLTEQTTGTIDTTNFVNTTSTLAAIASLRSKIDAYQKVLLDAQTALRYQEGQSFTRVLSQLDSLKQATTDQEKLTILTSLKKSIEDRDPQALAQKINAANQQMQELTVLKSAQEYIAQELAALENTIKELDPDSQEYKDTTTLIESFQALNTFISKGKENLIKVSITTFSVRMRLFLNSIREYLLLFYLSASETSIVQNLLGFKQPGFAASEEQKEAALNKLFSQTGQTIIENAYTLLEQRAIELQELLTSAELITQTIQDNQTLSTQDKRATITNLRTSLVDYLNGMDMLAKTLGVYIKNPDSLLSRIFEFVKMWYLPDVTNPTQEDLWLAQAISDKIGQSGNLVTVLNEQSKRASALLESIDSTLFKQVGTPLRALYGFSFIPALLAHMGGIAVLGSLSVVQIINNLNLSVPLQFLINLPPLIALVAATIIYSASYGVYRSALAAATAGSKNTG